MEDLCIGKLLDNRYEILEQVGSGGMAEVYKAKCHRLNRMVAVKILKSDLADSAEFRRRFMERFGWCRCGELLANEASEADRKWADEIGAERVCPVFIMETVRLLEDYLQELGL